MTPTIHKVFMDTSVVFAAILSPIGGARKLFQLGEAGFLKLTVGPNVLRECESVVRKKMPASLPTLARLLDTGRVETAPAPIDEGIQFARSPVSHEPDAYVLAEAIRAAPDWFVTHDKEHFLKESSMTSLPFHVGTPGDLIQSLKDDLALFS
jgi:predicted nucleic acid-binding protein